MLRRALVLALVTGVALLLPSPATAAKKGPNATSAATCAVDGTTVSASGLPTDEVINFMVTDSSGTYGWALGITWEGTWTLSVPVADEPTTYQFVSRTWGNDGSRYTVFAACSA